MKLSSPDFENGQPLPSFCAYRAENKSPELKLEDVPQNTKSLALIMDDPDAPRGTWVHWVLWNIPPDVRTIKRGQTPDGAVPGRNDFGNTRYDGPAPPSGVHRYYFRAYALDQILNLAKGSTKSDLLKKIHGHVLASAELMGTFAASR